MSLVQTIAPPSLLQSKLYIVQLSELIPKAPLRLYLRILLLLLFLKDSYKKTSIIASLASSLPFKNLLRET